MGMSLAQIAVKGILCFVRKNVFYMCRIPRYVTLCVSEASQLVKLWILVLRKPWEASDLFL